MVEWATDTLCAAPFLMLAGGLPEKNIQGINAAIEVLAVVIARKWFNDSHRTNPPGGRKRGDRGGVRAIAGEP